MIIIVFMSYYGIRFGYGGFVCLGWILDIIGFIEWYMVCKFIVFYLLCRNIFNKDINV